MNNIPHTNKWRNLSKIYNFFSFRGKKKVQKADTDNFCKFVNVKMFIYIL